MNYEETIQYLFTATPMFQKIGGAAYKPGLGNIEQMDEYFQHPHKSFTTIHIAGTNGKGSVSHTLAAIFQSAGYKTGLFTSPHLVDFRERIRVNGEMASKEFVIQFVKNNKDFFDLIHPSFFEVTTMMAFSYFKEQKVDIAIIETGMGGRLDCTNIIQPILSIITNISKDHTQYLGSTISEIAYEKAGIIKKNTPVVIGEGLNTEVESVFNQTSNAHNSEIYYAESQYKDLTYSTKNDYIYYQHPSKYPLLRGELRGYAQVHNTRTLLTALDVLQKEERFLLKSEAILNGFENVTQLTGLLGRWQCLYHQGVRLILDTGHNEAGMKYNVNQLQNESYERLHIVIGMVKDKDIEQVLQCLPKHAIYYFVKADIPRGMESSTLQTLAKKQILNGQIYDSVEMGIQAAINNAQPSDLIFIGGSNFIVAEALVALKK